MYLFNRIKLNSIQFVFFLFRTSPRLINLSDIIDMVATKTTAVYRDTMTSSILDVEEDSDSTVDCLREVLDARDVSTWNFDFRTSTPLLGRYDWQRLSGHSVAAAQMRRSADRDPFAVRRGHLRSTPSRSSVRRHLVFDDYDLVTADRTATAFLLRRLISSQRYLITQEHCSPELQEKQRSELHSTTSTPDAAVSVDNGQQSQKTVSSNVENCRVQSSTDRRTSLVATKRTRTVYENSSSRISKITGKSATTNLVTEYYKLNSTIKLLSLDYFFCYLA